MDPLSTILLVEDNPDDAELIRYAFAKAGIANPLVSVDDGEAALAYLSGAEPYADRRRHPLPALVLLDLKLPRCSGFDVLKSAKCNPPGLFIPFVVLTSSEQQVDVERAYSLGASSYLLKPVGTSALLGMVQTLNAYWIRLNRTAFA